MKTAAVEVKSVPDNLLDEVLGPLPEMPERAWRHTGHVRLGCHGVAFCGEPMFGRTPFTGIMPHHCPDCVRAIKAGR